MLSEGFDIGGRQMRIALFEFPADRNRLVRALRLRRSLFFWGLFGLFFGIGLTFEWQLFLGPQRQVLSIPPSRPSEWEATIFYAVWMGVVVIGFLFVGNSAVVDKNGVRFVPVLRPGKVIDIASLSGIDIDFGRNFQTSRLIFRTRDDRSATLLIQQIRDSDLQELCRAAGLKVIDKTESRL